jgi:hypothetical protein
MVLILAGIAVAEAVGPIFRCELVFSVQNFSVNHANIELAEPGRCGNLTVLNFARKSQCHIGRPVYSGIGSPLASGTLT